jgi:hypothetical protein
MPLSVRVRALERISSRVALCAAATFLKPHHPWKCRYCYGEQLCVCVCACAKLVFLNSEVCRVWRVFLDQKRNRPLLHSDNFVRARSHLSRPLVCRVIQQFNISYFILSTDTELELEPSVGSNFAPTIIRWTYRRSPLQLCIKVVAERVA